MRSWQLNKGASSLDDIGYSVSATNQSRARRTVASGRARLATQLPRFTHSPKQYMAASFDRDITPCDDWSRRVERARGLKALSSRPASPPFLPGWDSGIPTNTILPLGPPAKGHAGPEYVALPETASFRFATSLSFEEPRASLCRS